MKFTCMYENLMSDNICKRFCFPSPQRINEKLSVVSEYESGRAIPNQQIIAKMERVLG